MGQVCITETSWIHEEWSLDEWNDDGSVVGWHEDCERMGCTTVSSFSLESSEIANANLDTGATVDTFLVNFDREGVGYMSKLGNFKDSMKRANLHPWMEDLQMHICRDRVQGTTRLRCGTLCWLHGSDSQENSSRNENSFWGIVERVWNERPCSSLS